jgi:hypothetical protein
MHWQDGLVPTLALAGALAGPGSLLSYRQATNGSLPGLGMPPVAAAAGPGVRLAANGPQANLSCGTGNDSNLKSESTQAASAIGSTAEACTAGDDPTTTASGTGSGEKKQRKGLFKF